MSEETTREVHKISIVKFTDTKGDDLFTVASVEVQDENVKVNPILALGFSSLSELLSMLKNLSLSEDFLNLDNETGEITLVKI